MFGLGLVRCEMAKEGMLLLRRVISHNDGLTESTVYVPHKIPSSVCVCMCAPRCVNTSCLCFLYLTLGMCALMWLSV